MLRTKYRGLERPAALESLHPAHPGRGRHPHPQGPAACTADLASARALAHILVCFPRLYAEQVSRDVAAALEPEHPRAPCSRNSPAIQSHDVILATATPRRLSPALARPDPCSALAARSQIGPK